MRELKRQVSKDLQAWLGSTHATPFPWQRKLLEDAISEIEISYAIRQELRGEVEALEKQYPTRELPREIVELIHRASCCKDTPEEAQKEPCACAAAFIVEKLESWASQLTVS